MGMAGRMATGALAGATTMLSRSATRRAMHEKGGAPRLPRRTRYQRGVAVMLAWAAAAGVILALADVLREQRKHSDPAAE